ncbi:MULTISPECIES: ThiF family adenylyltransferase [unclassified Crossiella]|uniref:HesA/MoeB/ThiF family protein n=1 Tax=unclassified Crossiella TaxID=2620835 RepID=UPI001FFE58B7|nr:MULTISPECIES: ThiF family adenylyltransferase [unclassified Crossiella]MCK2243726.1 ThiF family adenylyltransferase [Crossiella sp. S99.2]MCK2257585.1 ThiF family adenylyltransferase [Crossiella sp. S99.1]
MWRPRIKFEHRPVRHGLDRIRFGGDIPGLGTEVWDPDGWVWALAGLLDGTRTVDQVVAALLVHRFPGKTRADVLEDLHGLLWAGYLEGAAEVAPEELTAAERERYDRGRAFYRWLDRTPRTSSWDIQMQLRKAHVTLLGMGGAGSVAGQSLALSGVGHLHIVDPDVVERSNLNRHVLATEADLGRPKVDVAVDKLRACNPTIEITGERSIVDGVAAACRLAMRCQILLCTADTPRVIRSWVNQACVQTGTAWVHGGYHGPQVNIGVYQPGTGPCYDCAVAAHAQRLAEGPPLTMWPAAEESIAVHAANSSSAATAGVMAAHAVMSVITGAPGLRVNCEYGINLATLQSAVLGPDLHHPDCQTCYRASI